jgi:hypothetical protein
MSGPEPALSVTEIFDQLVVNGQPRDVIRVLAAINREVGDKLDEIRAANADALLPGHATKLHGLAGTYRRTASELTEWLLEY